MDLVTNWEQTKDKINKLIIFERDGINQTIKMRNFQDITQDLNDPLLKQFMDVAAKLGEDVLKTLFNTVDVDTLPVEFREEGDYGILKFGDKNLFETVYKLLEAIFKGDIVRDNVQGNRTALENLLRELKQYST